MPRLKEALVGVLDSREIEALSSSFDVIGDIAIIKIPEELSGKKELIANELLKRMKNVHTVFQQSSDVHGDYRIRDLSFLIGENKFDTIYKESGCSFRVKVDQVYFSPRLSTERERIAGLVGNGEHILNMFAGIGTFSIIIAKQKECLVDSLDINPEAIELTKESLKLNKKLKGTVAPILADAKEYASSHRRSFDRILMPLPEKAPQYLESAFLASKKDAFVHYYLHVPEKSFIDKNWISEHLASLPLSRQYEIENWKRVREVGPRFIQAVADIRVKD